MMNSMKRWTGAWVLLMAVGCGPMEPVEETTTPEQVPPAGDSSVEAAGVPEFFECLDAPTEQARACVVLCTLQAPAASLVPCLLGCGLNLTTITQCLPVLAQ